MARRHQKGRALDWRKRAIAVAGASLGVVPLRTFDDIYAYMMFGRDGADISDSEADEVDAVATEFNDAVRHVKSRNLTASLVCESAEASARRAYRAGKEASAVFNAFNAVLVANDMTPLPGCLAVFSWVDSFAGTPQDEGVEDLVFRGLSSVHDCWPRDCASYSYASWLSHAAVGGQP